MTTKSNSSKNNNNEALETQVMRVLNDMVNAGEAKKKIVNGEEYFTLTTTKPAKKYNKDVRTAAAHKAWVTRRKTKTTEVKFKPAKTTTKAAAVNLDILKLKRQCAGQRAAITRKLNLAKKSLHTTKIGK